jgi:hypothetical protein
MRRVMAVFVSVLFILCLSVTSSGCIVDCEDITLGQTQSADGIYGARAHYVDCGAVGEFSLNLTLTQKIAYGYTSQRDVLNIMGQFTARFDWPEPRLLRVTVGCGDGRECTDDEAANLRKEIASSDRAWRELKIEYFVQ